MGSEMCIRDRNKLNLHSICWNSCEYQKYSTGRALRPFDPQPTVQTRSEDVHHQARHVPDKLSPVELSPSQSSSSTLTWSTEENVSCPSVKRRRLVPVLCGQSVAQTQSTKLTADRCAGLQEFVQAACGTPAAQAMKRRKQALDDVPWWMHRRLSASDVSLDAEDQKSEKGKRRRQAAAVRNEQNNWHSYSDVEADSSLGTWPDWLPRTWLMGFHPK